MCKNDSFYFFLVCSAVFFARCYLKSKRSDFFAFLYDWFDFDVLTKCSYSYCCQYRHQLQLMQVKVCVCLCVYPLVCEDVTRQCVHVKRKKQGKTRTEQLLSALLQHQRGQQNKPTQNSARAQFRLPWRYTGCVATLQHLSWTQCLVQENKDYTNTLLDLLKTGRFCHSATADTMPTVVL